MAASAQDAHARLPLQRAEELPWGVPAVRSGERPDNKGRSCFSGNLITNNKKAKKAEQSSLPIAMWWFRFDLAAAIWIWFLCFFHVRPTAMKSRFKWIYSAKNAFQEKCRSVFRTLRCFNYENNMFGLLGIRKDKNIHKDKFMDNFRSSSSNWTPRPTPTGKWTCSRIWSDARSMSSLVRVWTLLSPSRILSKL